MTAFARTALATAAFAIVGAAGLWVATDGARAFTAEGARRLRALAAVQPVPATILEDARGHPVPLRGPSGEVTLVEFIYTTCPTLCQSAGDAFLKLQARLRENPTLARSVRMLSVSFDLEKDGRDELQSYARLHDADGDVWKVTRPNPAELRKLLDAFAVVVVRDPVFGFTHNAAIHIVRQDGRLAAIHDLEDTEGVLASLRTMLGAPT